ncbi:MAG: hypothetical protein ABI867_06055 [Kofleriaceae bacterium]
MIRSAFDRAQLVAPLAIDQGESSWFCFEGSGRGAHGMRRLAGLVWIHRTGPRASQLQLGPKLVPHTALPARWRDLVPAWFPIISPVDLGFDDRPLFLIVLYDLDAPEARPVQIECAVDEFDPETFSARAGELELRDFQVRARCEAFELELAFADGKPMVAFTVVHDRIEVGYAQRPRIAVTGTIELAGERITDFVATGAHDRHWRESTVLGLRWLWLHARLAGDRELVAYVLEDAVGRNAWLVEPTGAVRAVAEFSLYATAHADTPRGRIPTRFCLDVAELDLALVFEHAVALPFIAMRAFGELADLGIYEAPIRVVSGTGCEGGWLEAFTDPGSAACSDRSR